MSQPESAAPEAGHPESQEPAPFSDWVLGADEPQPSDEQQDESRTHSIDDTQDNTESTDTHSDTEQDDGPRQAEPSQLVTAPIASSSPSNSSSPRHVPVPPIALRLSPRPTPSLTAAVSVPISPRTRDSSALSANQLSPSHHSASQLPPPHPVSPPGSARLANQRAPSPQPIAVQQPQANQQQARAPSLHLPLSSLPQAEPPLTSLSLSSMSARGSQEKEKEEEDEKEKEVKRLQDENLKLAKSLMVFEKVCAHTY